MKVLIKIGGTLVDDAVARQAIARELGEAARRVQVVVVHGGGKQMTRYLEERGIRSRFVEGLRVSDGPVIDAALKVIAGSVNKELVAAIVAAGGSAVGVSGIDGLLTTATALDPKLGFVGRPQETDGRLLDCLIGSGYLPVVACVAGDRDGNVYNVNADQMAVSCALGWRAERLIFLTDVPGVKNERGEIIDTTSTEQIQQLIESGVASGGMEAKLNAASAALAGGLEEIDIASGHEPEICRRLLRGERIGTRLVSEPAVMEGAAL